MINRRIVKICNCALLPCFRLKATTSVRDECHGILSQPAHTESILSRFSLFISHEHTVSRGAAMCAVRRANEAPAMIAGHGGRRLLLCS